MEILIISLEINSLNLLKKSSKMGLNKYISQRVNGKREGVFKKCEI